MIILEEPPCKVVKHISIENWNRRNDTHDVQHIVTPAGKLVRVSAMDQ
jgi:hypothetical protein